MTNKLRLCPKNANCRTVLHHRGTIRIEELPDGRATITVVRLAHRSVRKEILALSREEFRAFAELFIETAA